MTECQIKNRISKEKLTKKLYLLQEPHCAYAYSQSKYMKKVLINSFESVAGPRLKSCVNTVSGVVVFFYVFILQPPLKL